MGGVTAVFVHGVPETPAVWHGLLAALDRPDAVALSLPGFDGARPPVSERRWTSTLLGSRQSSSASVTRSISSGTIGAAGSWSGWCRPDLSWSDPG